MGNVIQLTRKVFDPFVKRWERKPVGVYPKHTIAGRAYRVTVWSCLDCLATMPEPTVTDPDALRCPRCGSADVEGPSL